MSRCAGPVEPNRRDRMEDYKQKTGRRSCFYLDSPWSHPKIFHSLNSLVDRWFSAVILTTSFVFINILNLPAADQMLSSPSPPTPRET